MSKVTGKKSITKTTKTVVKPTTTIKLSKTNEKSINDGVTRKLSVPSNATAKPEKVLVSKKSDSSLLAKPDVIPKKLVKSKSTISSVSTSRKTTTSSKDVAPVKQSKVVTTKPSKESQQKPLKAFKQVSKANVLSTIHNVTVNSPPSSAGTTRSVPIINLEDIASNKPRDRTRTRTLEPEEIVVLRPELVKSDTMPEIPKLKPVAFEINFEEAKKTKLEKKDSPVDDYSYESDFESYESDFESELSTSKSKSLEDVAESDENENEDDELIDDNHEESDEDEDADDDNETEVELAGQELVNVKNRRERQLDSGSFDLVSKRLVIPNSQLNSMDESTIHSSDSGISYDDTNAVTQKREMSPRIHALYQRSYEIMKKISLDDMKFNLYEAKPIPYDIYMQLYGQRNTEQSCCQTDSFTADEITQTERVRKTTIWTQFPPTFSQQGLSEVGSKLNVEEKNGVGEILDNGSDDVASDDELKPIVESLNEINKFSRNQEAIGVTNTRKTNDFQRLNVFLQNASITIANIIEKNSKSQEFQPSKMSVSRGFYLLPYKNQDILKNSKITKVYSNSALNNLLVTVHRLDDNLQNLMCLWNVLYTKNPLKIFSSWSEIACLEIHHELPEVIVAGCRDGTIAVWDSKESVDVKQKIAEQDISVVTPCEVVCLNDSTDSLTLINTVAIKSLPQRKLKSQSGIFKQTVAIQICSLHENGFLAIWTVLKLKPENLDETAMENLSFVAPLSKIKLVKNFVIDLNAKLGINVSDKNVKKSKFEKKVYYFENDIFSDKVLKELQQMDEQKHGKVEKDELLFFDLDMNLNEFFIASDSNFVLACSRINLDGKSRKINVDSTSFLTPSVVRINPADRNVLAVGLSNGNLIFVDNKQDEGPQEGLLKSQNASTSKRSSSEDSGAENILSKSCTIQNIIENERKLYDETQALNNLEMDELKAFLINEALAEQFQEQNSIKLNVIFDKCVFSNFIVNRGAVRAIEFTRSGELMFVLVGDRIRVFNCIVGQEVETDDDNYKFRDLKCVRGGDGSNYLILLTSNNEILVNKLKK